MKGRKKMKSDFADADYVRQADGSIVKKTHGDLDPIAAALYTKPSSYPSPVDSEPPAPPVKKPRAVPVPLVEEDFVSCYLPDLKPEEIKETNFIMDIGGAAPWKLSRHVLNNGRVMYRLRDGRAEQVGIFFYADGVENYAPVSAQTLIPSEVLVMAKQAVARSHRLEIGRP
jgi:hypothetical protein